MNITFLIGNGFDIGMGLRSKFAHYFSRYIEESKSKDYIFKEFADEIDKNREEWSYFEKKLGEYTTKFTLETQNVFQVKLRDFELGFAKYLREEETKILYDKERIESVFKEALLNFYKNDNFTAGAEEIIQSQYNRYTRDNHIYNFINFNYTEVLKNCLSVFSNGVIGKRLVDGNSYVDKIGTIVHIHGYKDNVPLMGVNDVTQIKNQSLAKNLRFARTLVKPLFNQERRTGYDKKANELIASSHIICIYGMALGETDADWWRRIVRWLCADGARQLIIFQYDEEYSESSQFDYFLKVDVVMDKLIEFNKNEKIDVESLRGRIHITVQRNIFALNLRNEETEMEKEVAVTE